ncbi:hypothetical protein KFL_000080100 [Klebsormidium nitens]|uniref:BSD domain-containing protein n=1 Tax=Klebsormidium nitens TaxID=105231 RepID=A0A1Y1HNC1_KLENI|nr:hypothetical protein KFL_000080100 [Klebsormidium nitens]|eukprot:GAQ78106.1 hypothetical protein KFL_000080100 [Klebsormidium nitens]
MRVVSLLQPRSLLPEKVSNPAFKAAPLPTVMDSFFKKAQEFASASLKKSQELATTAAAQSRELATETAKQTRLAAQSSYKAAAEASKKAEIKLKQLALDLNAKGGPGQPSKEQELQEAGITEELIDFIRGIDIKTFRQFPLEDALSAQAAAGLQKTDSGISDNGSDSPSEKTPKEQRVDGSELTPFQEHHATLVLQTVQEVADFRYVLCPRRMKESRFWKIYFTLVHSHIAPYEARWQQAQAAKQPAEPPAETAAKDSTKPSAAATTAASIAETMKPLQESFLVGIQEVRAGLTQAGRTIASSVTSSSPKPAEKPKSKPANGGIRDLAAVKAAADATPAASEKKPAVRETTGAVQTATGTEPSATNPDKKEGPRETDGKAAAGGAVSQAKAGGGNEKGEETDLDAYLMGALDDDVDDDDDGEGFNEEDFEKLVNSGGFMKDEHKADKGKVAS